MNPVLIIILILIIIASILCYMYLTIFNKLYFFKIRIDEAENVIIDEVDNRYKIISKLKPILVKSTKKEIKIFKELEELKKTNASIYDLEIKINEVINTINIIKNDFPKLDEKKEFKENIRLLEESTTRINAAKSYFNENNQKLRTYMKKISVKIIAKMKGIITKPLFSGKEIFNEIDDGIKI